MVREPLLHFVLIGALLFAVHAFVVPDDEGMDADRAGQTIRITERELSWLARSWSRQWQREPTEADLAAVVVDYLREELLAREALSLELDRDDLVVRRRLAQKMQFLVEDTAAMVEPDDAQLRAIFDSGRERFRVPARASFLTVFFSLDRRGERAEADALAALDGLGSGGDPGDFGDGSVLPGELRDAEAREIEGVFGPELAAFVASAEPGRWLGPVRSSVGLHLVRVESRTPGRPQTFEEARPALTEWSRRERERAARAAYFTELLDRYDVETTGATRALVDPALAVLKEGA